MNTFKIYEKFEKDKDLRIFFKIKSGYQKTIDNQNLNSFIFFDLWNK